MSVMIWHDPTCGTSRKVLALLRECRLARQVVEYPKTPRRSA